MIGYSKKDKQVCLITEFVNGGNLADYIHDNTFPQSLKIELCLSLCRGMIYIHSQSICHRDLKPANILVFSNLFLTYIFISRFNIWKVRELKYVIWDSAASQCRKVKVLCSVLPNTRYVTANYQ